MLLIELGWSYTELKDPQQRLVARTAILNRAYEQSLSHEIWERFNTCKAISRLHQYYKINHNKHSIIEAFSPFDMLLTRRRIRLSFTSSISIKFVLSDKITF